MDSFVIVDHIAPSREDLDSFEVIHGSDDATLSEAVNRYCLGHGQNQDLKDITRKNRPYQLTELDHGRLLATLVENRDHKTIVQLRKWGLDRIGLRDGDEAGILDRLMFRQELEARHVLPILNELRQSWGFSLYMPTHVRRWAIEIALKSNEIELLETLREHWKATKEDLKGTGLNAALYAAVHRSVPLLSELCEFWGITATEIVADNWLAWRVAVKVGAKRLLEYMRETLALAPKAESAGEVIASELTSDAWLIRRLHMRRPVMSAPFCDDIDPSNPPCP